MGYSSEEVGRGYGDIQLSHDKYRLHNNILHSGHDKIFDILVRVTYTASSMACRGLAQFHDLGAPAALSKSFCDLKRLQLPGFVSPC